MRLSFLTAAFFVMSIGFTVMAQDTAQQDQEIKTVTVPGTKAQAEQQKNAASETGASSTLKVRRAVICSSVENLEPVGVSNKFPRDSKEIFYFTHITGAKNPARIEHRWYHNGQRMQTTVLHIRSVNWRTFSKRSIIDPAEAVGEWMVQAVDQSSGAVLNSATFLIE